MARHLNPNAIVRIGFVAACTMATGFVCPRPGGGQTNPPAQSARDHVHKWIADLGSDSFAARETATQRLTAAGVQAVRAVSAAALNREPEVAWRARAILRRIAQNDGTSMEVLLDVERTGPEPVAQIVRGILKLPAVQEHYKLFKKKMKEQSEAELSRARRDVMLRRTESAWRRVRQLQSLDKKYGLFGKPNPILAVIACLEVESPDTSFRASGIRNRVEKVRALLKQARIDLIEGRIEEARRFATVANRLGISLASHADPRLLLAEIKSITLLRTARADIAAGRLDAARKKVLQLQETDRQYGLFAHAVDPETRALFVLFRANDLEGDLKALSAKPRELAAALLQLARADLESQRFHAARRKAASAQALGVDDRAKFFVKDIDDILDSSVTRRVVAQRLLEIGQEFANEGDVPQAKNWLAHIVRVYPATVASIKAGQLLKSLP